MPKKRRRKDDPRDDSEDFQMMDIDVNPSPSVPIATSTSTSTSNVINFSQWDIDRDRIHGISALASIDDLDPTAAATQASATDSNTQTTFDYNIDLESTFHDHDADEDISPDQNPSPAATGRGFFLSVPNFRLTTIITVLILVPFFS
jgi:hypothetical protein